MRHEDYTMAKQGFVNGRMSESMAAWFGAVLIWEDKQAKVIAVKEG